jgi:hypothetical protein
VVGPVLVRARMHWVKLLALPAVGCIIPGSQEVTFAPSLAADRTGQGADAYFGCFVQQCCAMKACYIGAHCSWWRCWMFAGCACL